MPERWHLIYLILAASLVSFNGCAAAGWNTVYFNGKDFTGQKTVSINSLNHKDGFLPYIDYGGRQAEESKLPEDFGAVAGISYIQVSGGKIHAEQLYLPLSGEAIEISGEKASVTARSDGNGYFILAVPSGSYEIKVRGMGRKVIVEKGKTSIVAIRGGKRIVD